MRHETVKVGIVGIIAVEKQESVHGVVQMECVVPVAVRTEIIKVKPYSITHLATYTKPFQVKISFPIGVIHTAIIYAGRW